MGVWQNLPYEEKMRIIQETVPGKQVTLAHVIANPDPSLLAQLDIALPQQNSGAAIGILTMSPAEIAIIAGDIAMKASGVVLASLDRVSGTLIVCGAVAEVNAALEAVVAYACDKLGCNVCDITRT